MKKFLSTVLKSVLCLFLFVTASQAQMIATYGKSDDLPPGVPRVMDTNGNVVSIEPMFTTPAFEEEGLRLVIEEANRVARDLQLPDKLPITVSNLTRAFIAPFGYTHIRKRLGNVTTSNYTYNVGYDFKFSDLTVARYDERCLEYYHKYKWPLSKLDTNTPYLLATQWLAALHMDVAALNRECDVHVSVSPYWNDVELGEIPKETFSPLYYVWWTFKNPNTNRAKVGPAGVELFLPTKELIQLNVSDPKYILRPPLVFTNLAALFPGKAEIRTYRPGPIIPIRVGPR